MLSVKEDRIAVGSTIHQIPTGNAVLTFAPVAASTCVGTDSDDQERAVSRGGKCLAIRVLIECEPVLANVG
ncbi:MAG: hypothetical protein WB621_25930 [Candidatus Acidiferrales bacterium]